MKKLSFHFLSDPLKLQECLQSTFLINFQKWSNILLLKKANFDSKMSDVSYGWPYSTWYSLTFMARHQTNRVVLCPFFFVWNGSINLSVVASSAQFSSAQQCWALWGCSEVNWSHVPVYLSLEHLVPHHGFFFSQEKKRDSFVTFNFLSHLGVVTEVKNHLGILWQMCERWASRLQACLLN